ncbi:MAG: hypothetical protein IKW28_02210 [Lachnospiraceae bacterium]|nr:hypothetical protein [Lachnospiraceae bacterium]
MAKKKPHKYTRKLQFNPKARKRIIERDEGKCIFCEMGYFNECSSDYLLDLKDIMHFVPKSQLGMGVEENGAVGCRYHHTLLDNGNKGLRSDMLQRFEQYLRGIYPEWDKTKLIYKKYDF